MSPRIRLLRSFDERTPSHLGYVLRIEGTLDEETGEFLVAIGKAAQEKHRFRSGMVVRGVSAPVADPRMQSAGDYKTSGIEVLEDTPEAPPPGPPFHGVPPDLPTSRARGHRRLDPRTHEAKCTSCIWGCRMPVALLIDPWNPSYRHRFETFYKAGAPRKVPGRKGMTWIEEDWVDEEETAHRGPDGANRPGYSGDRFVCARLCCLTPSFGDSMSFPTSPVVPCRMASATEVIEPISPLRGGVLDRLASISFQKPLRFMNLSSR